MKTKYLLILFFTIISLSGCARMHAGQNVIFGSRLCLLIKTRPLSIIFKTRQNKSQLYVLVSRAAQGVWSYVGRTEYLTGRYPQARQSLERALSADRNENKDIARLYLGMTLAREGYLKRGVEEIEAGMRGINDWLDYVNRAFPYTYGKYWMQATASARRFRPISR